MGNGPISNKGDRDDGTLAVAVFSASLLIAVLFLAGLSYADSLTKFPSSIATLIGAIIAGSMVAWQTHAGFRNTIRAQDARALQERESRVEQAKIARDQEMARRKDDAQALSGALRGELSLIFYQTTGMLMAIQIQEVFLRALIAEKKQMKLNTSSKGFPTTIFERNIDRLGLLGAEMTNDVLMVYGTAQLVGEMEVPNADIPEVQLTALQMRSGLIKTLRIEVPHLLARLEAQEGGNEVMMTIAQLRDTDAYKEQFRVLGSELQTTIKGMGF